MAHGWTFKLLAIALLWTSLLGASSHLDKARAEVAPYLLPEDHPIKPSLDALFGTSRVILNLKTLEAAGFKKSKPRKFTKLIVTSHHQFPGYIFKIYVDAQRYVKNTYEHVHWIMRVQGVEKIRREIIEQDLEWGFKAPKKWIYALPPSPPPLKDYPSKHYILVEEDMDIFADKENKALWASDFVTPKLLDALFHILQTVGLDDCLKPDNIPFSKDGKIAFIDTQTHGRHVEYKRLLQFLSAENQIYWKLLIQNKGDR